MNYFLKNIFNKLNIELTILPSLTLLFVFFVSLLDETKKNIFLGYQVIQIAGPIISLNYTQKIIQSKENKFEMNFSFIFLSAILFFIVFQKFSFYLSLLLVAFTAVTEVYNLQIVYNRVHLKNYSYYFSQILIRLTDIFVLLVNTPDLFILYFIVSRFFLFFLFSEFFKGINFRISFNSVKQPNRFLESYAPLMYYLFTLPVFYTERIFGFKIEMHYFNYLFSFLHSTINRLFEFKGLIIRYSLLVRLIIICIAFLVISFDIYPYYLIVFIYLSTIPYFIYYLRNSKFSYLFFGAFFSLLISLPFVYINIYYFKLVFIFSQLIFLFFEPRIKL